MHNEADPSLDGPGRFFYVKKDLYLYAEIIRTLKQT